MIRQATVEDIGNKRITKLHGDIVVVTQYYPRFLKRNLIHEYHRVLAPTRALLSEFKDTERARVDESHDDAFDDVNYEEKFTLSKEGMAVLAAWAERSKERDVYFVCHCRIGQRCHREILLLAAEKYFGAKISKTHFPWTVIRRRLEEHSLEAPDDNPAP
jgi:hypothetical protein